MISKDVQIKDVSKLISFLKTGKIGIIPTDTVYGLVCHFQNKAGIKRILTIKQRSSDKAFPLLVASWEQLETFIQINSAIKKYLLELSTPTTVIYKCKKTVKTFFNQDDLTIAIRLVTWKWLKKIVLVTGPIFATSCNLTSASPITTFNQLLTFTSQVDFIFTKQTPLATPSLIWDWEKQKKLR